MSICPMPPPPPPTPPNQPTMRPPARQRTPARRRPRCPPKEPKPQSVRPSVRRRHRRRNAFSFTHPSAHLPLASFLPCLPTLPTYIQSDPSPTLSIQVLPPLPVIEQCGINRNVTPREKKQWNKKKRKRIGKNDSDLVTQTHQGELEMECPPAHHVDTLTRALTYSALSERVILAPRGLRNSRTFRFSIDRQTE